MAERSAAPKPRLFLLGIDGGCFGVLDPLLTAGRLPVLAGLLARSAHGPTETTWPAHTAPGWTSLLSARAPGGHGVYQFFDVQHEDYGARVIGPTDRGCTTVWDWLAAQGLTLGLLNVPISHPPQDLPGYQVTWPLVPTLRYCSPPGLLADLSSQGMRFRSDLTTMFRGDLGYLADALENVHQRMRACLHLLKAQPTDVAMLVLTEPDRVCHHYWHFADLAHPEYTEPPVLEWADAVGLVFEAVDRALGELLAELDPQTAVLVVSDHGSGAGGHALALNRLLADVGLLTVTDHRSDPDVSMADWFEGPSGRVDFRRTAAYCPVPGSYGVNANLTGRQRLGSVGDPGPVLDEVIDLLLDLCTPEGGPAFRAVLPAEAAFPGPMQQRGPDLLLIPADETVMVTAEFDGPLWRPSAQTGLHRNEGMWAYFSPTVRPGRLDRPIGLADVLPTVLADLGLSWPDAVHGVPCTAVLAGPLPPPLLDVGPGACPDQAAPGEAASSTGDALRAMGYL